MNKKTIAVSIVALLSLVASPALALEMNGNASANASASLPTLVKAMAVNSGGTSAKEAGDSVALKFSEGTNKPVITAGNIASVLTLNNSHSFLDGAGSFGGASWSVDGRVLIITLSAGTSLATVDVGDTVTVSGSTITDLDGHAVTGSAVIGGSFSAVNNDQDENNEGQDEQHHVCANILVNGHLYMVGSEATVYMAINCELRPFRGAAVFHARGMKFENITKFETLPANVTISQKPVLPAEGTLVKGNDKTVWFVDHAGQRRGFVSASVFANLGFKFNQVDVISQSDLDEISTGNSVSDDTEHPDGALIKCGSSAQVFEVIGGEKFPFANAQAFTDRGHSFDHILIVDCGRFNYVQGAAVSN